MNLLITKQNLKVLDVDEIAVVLYVRLALNLFPAFFIGVVLNVPLHMVLSLAWPSFDYRSEPSSMFWGPVMVHLAWFAWMLFDVRQEVKDRPLIEITHTPTFYSWARHTQILSVISLVSPLLRTAHHLNAVLDQVVFGSWMVASIMGGFYLIYIVLMVLIQRRPPMSVIWALLLACGSAFFPPALVRHMS